MTDFKKTNWIKKPKRTVSFNIDRIKQQIIFYLFIYQHAYSGNYLWWSINTYCTHVAPQWVFAESERYQQYK